jgi:hypothetical protein
MPTDLSGTPTFRTVTSVPTAGDLRTATSVQTPFQQLTDSAAYLKQERDGHETRVVELESRSIAAAEMAVVNWSTQQRSATGGIVIAAPAFPGQRLLVPVTGGFFARSASNQWPYIDNNSNTWRLMAGPSASTVDIGSNGANTLLLMGSSTFTPRKSFDLGATWSDAGTAAIGLTTVGYSNLGARWLLGASGGSVYKSTDLATWTLLGVTMTGDPLGFFDSRSQSYMIYLPKVAGSSLTHIAQSADGGNSWTDAILSVAGAPRNLTGACYNAYRNEWLITSLEGDTWTATGGTSTWSQHGSAAPAFGRCAALGPYYVACSGNVIRVSPDGVNWLPVNEIDGNDPGSWHDVAVLDPGTVAPHLVLARCATVTSVQELDYRYSHRLVSSLYS